MAPVAVPPVDKLSLEDKEKEEKKVEVEDEDESEVEAEGGEGAAGGTSFLDAFCGTALGADATSRCQKEEEEEEA